MTDYEPAAKEAAGNWRSFESFGWHDRPDDADEWTIVYTTNRDADALTRANAASIAEAMKPFCGWIGDGDCDASEEHHGHWAVGWVDGYAIRVRNAAGEITEAFRTWCDLQASLEEYPVLDDEKFSEIESEDEAESWENYGRRDFMCEIRKHAPWLDRELDRADADDVRTLYDALADKLNSHTRCEHHSDGCYFYAEKVCYRVKHWSEVRKALVRMRQGRAAGKPYFWTGSKLSQ